MQHPVRSARKGKSLTQAELAHLSGVDASMISRIERGEDGRLRTYRFLGRALGIDYRTLLPADADASTEPSGTYSEATGG